MTQRIRWDSIDRFERYAGPTYFGIFCFTWCILVYFLLGKLTRKKAKRRARFPPRRLRVVAKQKCALHKAYLHYLTVKGKLAIKWGDFKAKIKTNRRKLRLPLTKAQIE